MSEVETNEVVEEKVEVEETKQEIKAEENEGMIPKSELQRRLANERKKWEKEKSFAEMTAEERVKAKEKDAADKEAKAEQRIKEAEDKIARIERAEAVRQDLSDSGLSEYINATQVDLLLIKSTDEDTKKATDALKGIIENARKGIQKELLKGSSISIATSPKVSKTKEEIMKIRDSKQRQEAIKENIELFQ